MLLKNSGLRPYVNLVQRRYKDPYHWSNIENRNFPRFHALNYFDDFYQSAFGQKLWRSLRLGLLCNNKYCAVVNNYSHSNAVKNNLENGGAVNMGIIYEMQKYELLSTDKLKVNDESQQLVSELEEKIDEVILKKSMDDKLSSMFDKYENTSINANSKYLKDSTKNDDDESNVYVGKLSLCDGLKDAHIDPTRIVDPKNSLSFASLYNFVPATKIQGLEDWVPESKHYEFYQKSLDFPINVEPDELLTWPEHLEVYVYEKNNITSFPSPTIGPTGLLDYYVLDGGSIIPVLALNLERGDKVLDMCGAPGGKALTAMQTLLPDEIVCNDVSLSRVNRIEKVVKEYLFSCSGTTKFTITNSNALHINMHNYYNKILVDVPCTNDRLSVHRDTDNFFATNRNKERLLLPELQADLLLHALELIPVGGTVVYSTCSLSPVQNDGVVQMALKRMWQEGDHEFVVKDLREAFKPLNVIYYLGLDIGMKYGIMVLPHLTANFGPMYISKLERVK